jgi:peptidoglycan/LPS O-acetylase OafA/YrhL
LGVELKFYFVMFALLIAKRLRWIEPIACAWLGAIAAFRLADVFVGLPGVLATPLILDYAHLFVAGIMFYRLRSIGHSWLRHALIGLSVPMQFWAEGPESAVIVMLLVGVFYLFVSGRLQWIVNRPLQYLGVISYALYLIHGSLGVVIIHWLDLHQFPVFVLLLAPTLASMVRGRTTPRRAVRATAIPVPARRRDQRRAGRSTVHASG